MGRSTPKIVVLVATAIIVAAIYYVTLRGRSASRPSDPGVVYVDPGIGSK